MMRIIFKVSSKFTFISFIMCTDWTISYENLFQKFIEANFDIAPAVFCGDSS